MPRSRRETQTHVQKPQSSGFWGGLALVLLAVGLVLAYVAFSSGPYRWGRESVGTPPVSTPTGGLGPDTTRALIGPVRVIDGDSLVQSGVRIRLEGVDAPEIRQNCFKGGVSWACGERSRDELLRLVGSSQVRCLPTGTDRYKRILATCFVDGLSIQSWMVSNGWAVAYSEYSSEYEGLEKEARLASRGIWGSEFERPSVYRRR